LQSILLQVILMLNLRIYPSNLMINWLESYIILKLLFLQKFDQLLLMEMHMILGSYQK